MMREYRTVPVPATTRTEVARRTCDLCGREAKPPLWTDDGTYDINETEVTVTVRHKEGFTCPDGGSGTETVIDLCPVCFKDRLLPWLRSQGAKIETREWDW